MIEKRAVVKLLGDAKEAYLSLMKICEEESAKGITNSFHQTLIKSINDKIEFLKKNYDDAIHIPRNRVPQKYVVEYEVTNLWKINLTGGWRMVYTLKQPQRENPEVEILSIWLDVLGIIDHKEYDKIFGYKKR